MTVLLVLLTFVTFLLIDHFHSRKQVVVQPALQAAKHPASPRLAPSLVGGFQVPEKLRFHPGHTWALSESPSLVRIGMDEFASKLTGKVERIAPRSAASGFARDKKCGRCIAMAPPSICFRRSRAVWPTSTRPSFRIPSWRAKILTAKAGW